MFILKGYPVRENVTASKNYRETYYDIVFRGTVKIASLSKLSSEVDDEIIKNTNWQKKLCSAKIEEGVTNVSDRLFYDCESLTSITVPSSVTTIAGWAFTHCNSLSDVYYSGSLSQWNSISIGEGNEPLMNATIHSENVTLDYSELEQAIEEIEGITVDDTVRAYVAQQAEQLGMDYETYLVFGALQIGVDEDIIAKYMDVNVLERLIEEKLQESYPDFVLNDDVRASFEQEAVANNMTYEGYLLKGANQMHINILEAIK